MFLGCHLSISDGFLAMGRTALSLGADTLQFFTRNPRGSRARALDEADIQAFRALCQEHRFGPLIAHAPYTLNPCSADEHTRQFARETLADDLHRLRLLPEALYNLHPGSHVKQGVETGITLISDMLRQVLDQDDGPTVVLLETMAGKGSEVGGTFEQLRQLLDRIGHPERMGVCLDTCHVWDAGYDIVNDLDGVLAEFDRTIGLDRLRALHINDSKNPLGAKKDRHEKIGQGQIGLDALVRLISHPVLHHLPMNLETPNELPGYQAEIELLRRMSHEQA